jgi:hypothetical protein
MTQRHSGATAPANIADDVPADLDLLEGEWTPTSAYFPAGPKPQTASEVPLQGNYFSVTFNCKKWSVLARARRIQSQLRQ